MSYVAAGMGVASLASGVIGSQAAQGQEQQAQGAQQQAVQQWLALNVPNPQQQQIELQNYAVTGQLSPQLEGAFQQSQTGLNGMQFNQGGQQAQMAALSQMQGLAQNGGLDAQAQQQTQQAINETNANAQGQIGAIVNNAAARGMGQGGGAMLAGELQAAQGGANSAAQVGQSAAANAQMRALQAMQGSGYLGGQLNAQDYGQAAAAAQAQDAINRFNTQNAQGIANANVTNANAAQAANLANSQSVANANTGVANQQEVYNQGLIQQNFQNQATKLAGETGQYNQLANQYNLGAQNVGNEWYGIGQGLAKGAGAVGQYAHSSSGGSGSGGSYGSSSGGSGGASSTGYSSDGSPNLGVDTSMSSLGTPAYAKGGAVPKATNFDQLVAYLKQQKSKDKKEGRPNAA